jgi:hypothetical protein
MGKASLLLLVALLAVAIAEEDKYRGPSEEDVIVLDADNLESTIYDSDETWLLELYAPWCGHPETLVGQACHQNEGNRQGRQN